MVRPMPVPSIGPVSWPARWNGSKIRSCLSGGMPMPSSTTVIRTIAGPVPTSNRTRPPGLPYLIAFEPKFIRICASRVRSASTRGSPAGSASGAIVISLRVAIGSSVDTTSPSTSPTATGSTEIVMPPASILARSSTSSIRRSRCSPPRSTWCSRSSWRGASGSLRSRSSSWANPRIALSGVRSSWLIDDRNSLLAALARSAASRARRSSSAWSTSSVTSAIIATVPCSAVLRSVTRRWRPVPVRMSSVPAGARW